MGSVLGAHLVTHNDDIRAMAMPRTALRRTRQADDSIRWLALRHAVVLPAQDAQTPQDA